MLADAVGRRPDCRRGWQAVIFDTSSRSTSRREAFAAVYRAFLDRPNGPRAGWLLASLDRAFVIKRLREAAA